MRTLFVFGSSKVWKAMLAAAVAAFVPTAARAALQFEAEQPTYSVGPTGTPQAAVRLFLVQTDGTMTISSQGDLN